MNKKRMKWIFFILTLTCFPVVLVYANGAPMPGANGYNTDSPAPSTNTGAPQPGANGYILIQITILSLSNLIAMLLLMFKRQMLERHKQQKSKQDKKKKDEKKIEKDDDYQSIQKKAENVDKVLKNKKCFYQGY